MCRIAHSVPCSEGGLSFPYQDSGFWRAIARYLAFQEENPATQAKISISLQVIEKDGERGRNRIRTETATEVLTEHSWHS